MSLENVFFGIALGCNTIVQKNNDLPCKPQIKMREDKGNYIRNRKKKNPKKLRILSEQGYCLKSLALRVIFLQ